MARLYTLVGDVQGAAKPAKTWGSCLQPIQVNAAGIDGHCLANPYRRTRRFIALTAWILLVAIGLVSRQAQDAN